MKRIILLLLIPFLFSCTVTRQEKPRILFEVERFNNAWGYVLYGFYVDNKGNVFSYDHSDKEVWSIGNTISEAQLLNKYNYSKELVAIIDSEVVLEQYDLVDAAQQGTLTGQDLGCRDFGWVSYTAYVYEPRTNQYIPVLLHQAGDWAIKNSSEEADSLVEWLNTIDDRFEDFHCQPEVE